MPSTPEAMGEVFSQGKPFNIAEADLTPLEDILVHQFLPPYEKLKLHTEAFEGCTRNWNARARLVDELKGKGFYGALIDLSITPMSDAGNVLVASGSYAHKLPNDLDAFCANVIGFTVTAALSSGNPNLRGTLERPVWLFRKHLRRALNYHQLWGRIVGKNTGDNTITATATALAHKTDRVLNTRGATSPGGSSETKPKRR